MIASVEGRSKTGMSARIGRFYRDAKKRGANRPHGGKDAEWSRAFFELFQDQPMHERQARSFGHALTSEPIYIHDDGLIVGQIYQAVPGAGSPDWRGLESCPAWNGFASVPRLRAALKQIEDPEFVEYQRGTGADGGAPAHIGWDWRLMLDEGVQGLFVRCQSGREQHVDDEAAQAFYTGVEIALNGFLEWTRLHVDALAVKTEQETDPIRADELRAMIEVCRRVPEQSATTFREAVQSFWFQHLAVMYENPFGGNSPGRLDAMLWPYLKADLETGRITLDQARELIAELFIKLHERIANADRWVEAVVVGGRHSDGSSAINPLSYMMIELMIELQQTHPSVYVRLHDDAPGDFVDLSVRYLIEGDNRGQVYGDDAVINALHKSGVAIEDARHWTAGGCMEVSPQGCNCDFLFSFAHNVCRTLEIVINGGRSLLNGERIVGYDRDLTNYACFEDLMKAFEQELSRELKHRLHSIDVHLEITDRCRPSFLLSSMVHDCLVRGRGLNGGGARYTDYGGSGVGIPNVGDSLYAIRRAVFEDHVCTAEQLLEALRQNFEGHESLRNYLLNLPKYGADCEEVDGVVDRVLQHFGSCLQGHSTPHGGKCHPVILGFVWVVSFGKAVGASPDGRRAGEPLAHGLSPQTGAARKSLTGAINSATRLDLSICSGGGSMMWDLDADWATPEVVKPLLMTFIRQGGHIFQGNVQSVDVLLAALRDPARHQDLIVRVGGYSARFVALDKDTQQEIISRVRYSA